jgi:hypothetical protein
VAQQAVQIVRVDAKEARRAPAWLWPDRSKASRIRSCFVRSIVS